MFQSLNYERPHVYFATSFSAVDIIDALQQKGSGFKS